MVKQIQQSNKMGQVGVSFSSTVFIRINAMAFIKFLALKGHVNPQTQVYLILCKKWCLKQFCDLFLPIRNI